MIAIYVRVSTDEQAEDGYSLEAQERLCRLYAELRSWSVGEVYIDDGYSGRYDKRPALQRLTNDIKAGKVTGVIVHKLDRLARNLHLLLELVNEWDRRNVAFVSVSEQMDFSTPMGRVVLQILGAIAEWYSNNLSLETKKGLAEKARQGGWVGPVPLGYQRTEAGSIVASIDAPAVQLIFELYASGTHSYISIADELNAKGYRALDWQTGQRSIFGRESIRTILKNKAYAGYVYSGSGSNEHKGNHQPLVDETIWQRCQAIREDRTRAGGKVVTREGALLSGLLRCYCCNSPMWYRHGGRSYNLLYYRCAGHEHRSGCEAPMVRADLIEPQVIDLIGLFKLPQKHYMEVLRRAERMLKEQQRRQNKEPVINRETVEEDIRRLGIAYANGAFGIGAIADAEYARRLTPLRALLQSAPTPISPPDLAAATVYLQDVSKLIAAASTEKRRAFLHHMFSRIYAEGRELKAIVPKAVFLPLIGTIVDGCRLGWLMGESASLRHPPIVMRVFGQPWQASLT